MRLLEANMCFLPGDKVDLLIGGKAVFLLLGDWVDPFIGV